MEKVKDYFGNVIWKGSKVLYVPSSFFHFEKAIVEDIIEKPNSVVIVLNCVTFGRKEIKNPQRLVVVDKNLGWDWEKKGF